MKILLHILLFGLGIVAMIVATRPPELHSRRGVRILFSLIWVWILSDWVCDLLLKTEGQPGAGAYVFLVSVMALAVTWIPVIAWWISEGFSRTLEGTHRLTGLRPSFQLAKSSLKTGDTEGAMALTLEELEKDPLNYEGLLLMAQIHLDLDQPKEALKQLDKIINNPGATRGQVDIARSEKQRIEFSILPKAGLNDAPPAPKKK